VLGESRSRISTNSQTRPDSGITSFFGVAIATPEIADDLALWTEVLGARVSDYVGDAAYLSMDDRHHRIALHPSQRRGILEVQFEVEGLDQIMQSAHFLSDRQLRIAHGPGRRPTSGQLFLSFPAPEGPLFGFVAEGETLPFDPARTPRQFPKDPGSFCAWGTRSELPEFGGAT
jgi:2,3-dihydroxy-p-cumate/2,3-dihydroxybenzoate 3,4-dioxygenase